MSKNKDMKDSKQGSVVPQTTGWIPRVHYASNTILLLQELKRAGLKSCAVLRVSYDYSGYDEILLFSQDEMKDWRTDLSESTHVEWCGTIYDLYQCDPGLEISGDYDEYIIYWVDAAWDYLKTRVLSLNAFKYIKA